MSERDFFEVKGDVDLNGTAARAKLAKFILGAANREPERAGRRFEGHALLILGVDTDGVMVGIPRFEAHQVEETIQKYIGVRGPAWDFVSLRVDDGRSVVVVLALPPEPDKQPWLCYRDHGPEKLANGAIYLRADGQTRPARAPEIEAMLERRAASTEQCAEISVELTGIARHYQYDEQVVEKHIEEVRKRLMDAITQPRGFGASPGPASLQQAIGDANAARTTNILGSATPEDRSKEQYIAEIAAWADRFRRYIPTLLDEIAAYSWQGSTLRVSNDAGYLLRPQFSFHLDGDVEAVDKIASPEVPSIDLPQPPRRWGPRSSISAFQRLAQTMSSPVGLSIPALDFAPRFGSVSFENGGSVQFEMELEDLRPGRTYDADGDFVLIFRGSEVPETLAGTWSATVAGHDRYTGQFMVPVERDPVDMTPQLARLFARELEDD